MRKANSLERQLASSMIAITVPMLLLPPFIYLSVYWFLLRVAPSLVGSEDSFLPSSTDLAILLALLLLGILIATQVAFRTAIRIAAPIRSVAEAARAVAGGDLSARAEVEDRSPQEITMLADDFNAMATRLEQMASEIVVWNAQIAHELRTPLQILRGRLQGAVDGIFIANDALLTGLAKQVDNLSHLVEDLRVVSLFDSGQLILDVREVDLAGEIADLADFVRPQLEAQGFWLKLTLDQGVSLADTGRIRQALMALIDNSCKYANPGPLTIKLQIRPSGTQIRVGDAGPGLTLPFAAIAFNLFSRHEGYTSSHRGSGLGLSVVQAIMRAHGGHATYDNDHLEFVLELPVY